MTTKKGFAFLFIALSMLLVGEDKALSAADKAQIKAVILRWYELDIDAMHNGGDVRLFPEVLINTPDYPLNADHKEFITSVFGSEAVRGAGFLTMMQTQYKAIGEGQVLLKNAFAKAEQENRDVTNEEWEEIRKKNYGQIPGVVYESSEITKLTFESIKLTREGRAVVRFYHGPSLHEYILVKVGDKWFISSGKTLKVNI